MANRNKLIAAKDAAAASVIKKREALEKARGDAKKASKIPTMEAEVEEAEATERRLTQEAEDCTAQLKQEFERFDEDKVADFQRSAADFVNSMVQSQQKVCPQDGPRREWGERSFERSSRFYAPRFGSVRARSSRCGPRTCRKCSGCRPRRTRRHEAERGIAERGRRCQGFRTGVIFFFLFLGLWRSCAYLWRGQSAHAMRCHHLLARFLFCRRSPCT